MEKTMKTREQLIEEYSQLGNAAIPIAIYDVGERLVETIGTIGYNFNLAIKTRFEDITDQFRYASQDFRSVCSELTNSHNSVLLHVRNFFRKN